MDHGTGNMLPPQLTRIEWRSCLRVVPVALAAAVAVMPMGTLGRAQARCLPQERASSEPVTAEGPLL